MKEGYDFVVVDTAPVPDRIVEAALDEADIIVLPVLQDLLSVRRAQAAIDWLATLRNKADIRLVLNQAGMENGIRIRDFEKTLGSPFAVLIPDEGEVVRAALNKGQPFVLGQVNARVSETVVELARQLAGIGTGTEGPRRKLFGWFKR
ncbi:MAG: AAA family ATPase [Desulfotomaculales bacterium]